MAVGPLSRIGLGAAQFGMPYGRFNRHGMPGDAAVAAMLARAAHYGLSSIDTAHLYGQSELALGRCAAQLPAFEIVTKTPRFADGAIDAGSAQQLREAFANSLAALRLSSVHGLLIHHAPNLLAPGGERLYDAMLALKRAGLVARIGVSVYDTDIAEAIQARFPMDLVQLPMNVLDQRPLHSGGLARLAAAGVRVHVRSAFLQGLLLADPATLDAHFTGVVPLLERFRQCAADAGISPAHAALHFLLGNADIDRVIVGVESVAHLDQLFADFPPPAALDYAGFGIDQPEILNPALWPQTS
jgi:aryl-alcohol dehydrogenase-like predicted oxidoreductase